MKTIKADMIRQRKQRIKRRLDNSSRHDRGKPMIAGSNTRYELAEKAGGTAYGGIAAIHCLAKKIKLPERIDPHELRGTNPAAQTRVQMFDNDPNCGQHIRALRIKIPISWYARLSFHPTTKNGTGQG